VGPGAVPQGARDIVLQPVVGPEQVPGEAAAVVVEDVAAVLAADDSAGTPAQRIDPGLDGDPIGVLDRGIVIDAQAGAVVEAAWRSRVRRPSRTRRTWAVIRIARPTTRTRSGGMPTALLACYRRTMAGSRMRRSMRRARCRRRSPARSRSPSPSGDHSPGHPHQRRSIQGAAGYRQRAAAQARFSLFVLLGGSIGGHTSLHQVAL
jgi:hypothetical protein